MTAKDLIPITTKERAIELGSRGGKVKSFKKKYAAKIREMKKRAKLTNQDLTWFENTILDSEASVIDIKGDIESLKEGLSEKDYIGLKLMWHKTHHGDKASKTGIVVTDSNVIINIVKPKKVEEL